MPTILIALVCLLALGGIGGIVTLIVLAVTGEKTPAPTSDGRPGSSGYVPPPLAPLATDDAEVARALRAGSCRRNDVERTKTRYLAATRQRGAASVLRGKVALVSFELSTPGTAFTPAASRAVTLTARTTRAYLLEQAKRWRVTDLSIDAIVWPLTTTSTIPTIRLGANKKPEAADGEAFRKATRHALESGIGRSLSVVVEDVQARGYDNVALLVSFPSGPKGIRDFAAPTGAKGDASELAYVLEPDWNPTSRSLVAAHELLHLFGADDLYEIRGVPTAEANDVMNAECDGLGATFIGETTAYAIGWTSTPPARSFTFDGG